MKMSKKELNGFLDVYGHTDLGRHIKEQLNVEPREQVHKSYVTFRRKVSVLSVLFKLLLVMIGLLVLTIHPVVGLLTFILAASISKWKNERIER